MTSTEEEQVPVWHRRFAAQANNRAWDLAERTALTADERLELLHAAHAAAHHWSHVGTPQQQAHADLLLGRVHALLGQGELAIQFARSAYEHFTHTASADWEIAFAHAVVADAAAAAGDGRLHEEHYRAAERVGAALVSQEDRELFLATFTRIPSPHASPDATS